MGADAHTSLATLLSRVPVVDEPPVDGLTLTGFLLRPQREDRVRLVVATACFEFAIESVAGIEERALPEGVGVGVGLPVDLELVPGAPILSVSSAAPYLDRLCIGRRPFAFRVRRHPPPSPGSPSFKRREESFLHARGVTADSA